MRVHSRTPQLEHFVSHDHPFGMRPGPLLRLRGDAEGLVEVVAHHVVGKPDQHIPVVSCVTDRSPEYAVPSTGSFDDRG